jgi:hypothetical protein
VAHGYPCPGCRTTTSLHDPECQFDGTPRPGIEKAYTDVVAALAGGPKDEDAIRQAADEWGPLRMAALDALQRERRVEERDGQLELLTPAGFREAVTEAAQDPIRTIQQEGSVPGCHDNAVFAMIAYYEMVGFSWEETRERVVDWLETTGTWARGGFEESTPAELVESKRHVYDEGYGWREKAEAAKRVIDHSV